MAAANGKTVGNGGGGCGGGSTTANKAEPEGEAAGTVDGPEGETSGTVAASRDGGDEKKEDPSYLRVLRSF